MSLTLQNFDENEDDAIIERGKEYFDSGTVSTLEEASKGLWEATVLGSETLYGIEVELRGKKIKQSTCTCPFFEQNDTCKHIIAVLFALREKIEKDKNKPKEKKVKEAKIKTPYQELQHLADKADDADLREFIKSYAVRNSDFTNSFLFFIRQVGVSKNATEEGYSELIKLATKNSIEKSRSYNTYINDDALSKYLRPLTDQIKKHLAEQNYLEASYIIKAMLGELSPLKEYTFSGDKTADIILSCVGFLEAIASSDVSFMFKDELYAYAMDKSGIGIFDETIFESKFNNLLLLLATDNQKRGELLLILTEKIKKITPARGANMPHNVLSKRLDLINTKLNLLEQMKRREEGIELIRDNVQYHDELRIKAVESAIEQKDYSYAKKLVREKIEDKVQQPYHSHRTDKTVWNQFLLKIAEAEKNKKDIVHFALGLFQMTLDNKYYQIAKKQVAPEEWKAEVEALLTKARVSHNSFNLFYRVYREEGMMDQLMALLKNNLNIYTLHTLAETLLPKFRKEILNLYHSELNKLAQDAQGSSYNMIRDHLKHLISIGAADTAAEIIAEYRVRYKNRPAMIERLDKVKFK